MLPPGIVAQGGRFATDGISQTCFSAAPSPAGFARVDVVSSPCPVKSERPIGPDSRADDAGPVVPTNKGSSGAMEIVFDGVTLRVDASVDSAALRKVLAALGRR